MVVVFVVYLVWLVVIGFGVFVVVVCFGGYVGEDVIDWFG